ncbi:MAG TPA: hypothetical protein PLI09_27360 [Candidatus Hydrogenedentes bacterium]|nr:hypothetical protein [Candidatus Hydrogenedentota bacterium]
MKTGVWIILGVIGFFSILPMATANADDPAGYEFSIKTSGVNEKLLEYLPKYAEYGFILYLYVDRGHIGKPLFKEVLLQAEKLNLRVKLCPGLSPALGGPFPNEENIGEFEKLVHEILDYTESINKVVTTVVLNIETGPPKDKLLQDAVAAWDIKRLAQMAAENINRVQYSESTKKIEALIQKVRNRGYEVQITTFPLLLDDLADGDSDLQDLFNIPMENISWDTRAFCAYSTEYGTLGGFPISPYFVYTYSLSALKHYGENTWIALGLIRYNNRGYSSPDQLAADIAAAKAAGIKKIDLFFFPGMTGYPQYTFDDWAKTTRVDPKPPKFNPAILGVRTGMVLADFLLNFIE